MGPEFFVDAAGIPRAVTPNNPLQKLQGIAGRFADSIDLGSAVKNQKVGNTNQIRQFTTQVPTPYNIRLQQQVQGMNLPGGGRTPRIPAPGMGLPLDPKLPTAAAPQATPGFQAPNLKIKPRVLPKVAVPVIDASTRIAGGENPIDAVLRSAFGGVGGFVGSTGAAFLGAEPADPITSSLAGYNVGYDQGVQLYDSIRDYKPGKPTAPSASDMMSGSRGPAPQTSYDIPFDQYPAGVPRPDGKVNVDGRPSLSIPDSVSEADKGKGPKDNVVGQDYDSVEPGIQGAGDPPGRPGVDTSRGTRVTDADEAMRIWAQTHGQLADRVIDKVENRGLQQAGYDAIKSVRQPGESAEFPVQMAGQTAPMPYIEDQSGTQALNREGFEGIPVEVKTKDATSAYSPAFGAQDFLDKYKKQLIGAQSEVKSPDVAQDPVVVPAGFDELSIEESDAAVKAKAKELEAKDNPQGIEDPEYRAMMDADILRRKAAGLPF